MTNGLPHRCLAAFAATILSLGGVCYATPLQDDENQAKVDAQETLEDHLKAFDKFVEEEMKTFNKALQALDASGEQMEYYVNNFPDFSEAQDALFRQVNKYVDDELAPRALASILRNNGPRGSMHTGATEMLFEKYGDSREAARTVSMLTHQSQSAATEKIFNKLLTNTTNGNLVASAKIGYAQYLAGIQEYLSVLEENPEMKASMDAEQINYFTAKRTMSIEHEIITICEELINDENTNGRIVKLAKSQLFASKYLAIGKTAPEIEGMDTEGMDTEGVEFKLSDYRGKIVLLDFWGHW